MTPQDVINKASALGLTMEVRGGNIVVKPAEQIPGDLLAQIRQHKPEILSILATRQTRGWQSIPPGDLPLNPVMPHPRLATRELVIGYLLRQGCATSNALTHWLTRRELAYFEGPGRSWDCALLAYAAARDCITWQLNRSEPEVWTLIQSLEEAVADMRRGQQQPQPTTPKQ